MSAVRASIVVCGAGIVGLTIARELLERGHDDILVLDKEPGLGAHGSGRNSGVLHAGIYYSPDTLKARFCLRGNRLLADYCRERGLPLAETGKVIVARDTGELATLAELHARALRNGARVELVDEERLAEIEPNARTHRQALYSHYTSVVDPRSILEALHRDVTESGGRAAKAARLLLDTRFVSCTGRHSIVTSRGAIEFDLFINCAGAWADRIAHAFGQGSRYRLIPFKGTYKKIRADKTHLFRGSIYPVPDIENPFLGVHFTKDIHGDVHLGPTAIPAFGRENYRPLEGLGLESLDIAVKDAQLFFGNRKFRKVALSEPKKYRSRAVCEDARHLVKRLEPEWIEPCTKVGIRPQLVDWTSKELVMDFVVVRDETSIHVLNAVSPAFTSSMEFARHIVTDYVEGGQGDPPPPLDGLGTALASDA